MKQIINFGITRLLTSASTEFHNAVFNIIFQFPSLVSALGSLVDDYHESISRHQRAANKDKNLANTRAIAEKDKARDTFLQRFFKSVADLARSPIAEEKEAAKTVGEATKRFHGLTTYEMNKQTGEVKNMIITLRQPAVWNAVVVLNLDGLVDRIENANIEFEVEMNTRVESESQKEKLITSKERKAAEAIYAQIVLKINATAVVMPSPETDNCIDLLNALIESYARTISRMRAGGSGNEKRTKKDND